MYKWFFRCNDNGGKHQSFQVSAKDKAAAINKGMAKAKKAAKGDILAWECELNRAFL